MYLYTVCIFLYGTTESVSLILLGSGGATGSGRYNYLKDIMIYLIYIINYKHCTCRFALDHAADEDVDEPVERVLVHGVNVGQVRDGEEQHASMMSHLTNASWNIPVSILCGKLDCDF